MNPFILTAFLFLADHIEMKKHHLILKIAALKEKIHAQMGDT